MAFCGNVLFFYITDIQKRNQTCVRADIPMTKATGTSGSHASHTWLEFVLYSNTNVCTEYLLLYNDLLIANMFA